MNERPTNVVELRPAPRAYRIVLSDNIQVLYAASLEDEILGGEDILAAASDGEIFSCEAVLVGSLEEANRIISERTAVPGMGGVIIGDPHITFPMRTKEWIAERYQFVADAAPPKEEECMTGQQKGELAALGWVLGNEWDSDQAIATAATFTLRMRSRSEISAMEEEVNDRYWYAWYENDSRGDHSRYGIKSIEARYPDLIPSIEAYGDLEWGVLRGKMRALNWVLGNDPDSVFDT